MKSDTYGLMFEDISTDLVSSHRDHYKGDDEEISINLNLSVSIGRNEEVVSITTHYTFTQQSKTIFETAISCLFRLDQNTWNQLQDDSDDGRTMTLPTKLLSHLVVLSIGTSRGVIHSTKPPWISRLILPTFNVTKMITDPMTFDLSDDES